MNKTTRMVGIFMIIAGSGLVGYWVLSQMFPDILPPIGGGGGGIFEARDRVLCDVQVGIPLTNFDHFKINSVNCSVIGQCALFEGSTHVGEGNIEVRTAIGNSIATYKKQIDFALGGSFGATLQSCKDKSVTAGTVVVVDSGVVDVSASFTIS